MMSKRAWLALIIIGFIISPTIGFLACGLYVFNYFTAILMGLWNSRAH